MQTFFTVIHFKIGRALFLEQFLSCFFFLGSFLTFDLKLIGPDRLWQANLLKVVISYRIVECKNQSVTWR